MNKLGKYWMAAMAMWSGGQAMATEPYTVGKLLGIPEFNTLAPFLILAVLVMAAAVAATACAGSVTVLGAEAVHKSYPDFFTVYQALGGAFHVL